MKKLVTSFLITGTILTSFLFSDVSYEVGIGANYGGIVGATVNKEIQPNIELYGGVGLVGAVAGARYYINDNVRLSANYGVHGFVVTESGNDENNEILHGINVGLDYMWSNGISLGLVYLVTSNMDDVIDEWEDKGYTVDEKGFSGDIKLSLGYRF